MGSNTKICLVDDHQLFRAGIRHMLQNVDEFSIVGEACTGKEALEICNHHHPDVVLLDIGLPDISGVEIARELIDTFPKIKILALSSHDDDDYVVEMFRGGASGYVVKDASIEELIRAINALVDGNSYFSKNISKTFFEKVNRKNKMLKQQSANFEITDRELEVLKYVTDEMTNKQIAECLFISPRTVETHKRNLMQKLKVKNAVGLVKYYLNLEKKFKPKASV